MPNTGALVDTGFLVALFARDDQHHDSAVKFLAAAGAVALHTVWPIVAEAAFFLDTAGKDALLEWIERGAIAVHELTAREVPLLRRTLRKYADLSPDLADLALVVLAERLAILRIVTVDVRDFSVYRLGNGQSFVRIWL
ncbi:MAG: PIN domain-containing protein [Betaproteobacteria bacterium]|nr:PIN domain-containing protein [Betaproteobacteria bacterium]